MSEQIYGPLITATITLLFGWLLISGFRRGEMWWGYFGMTYSGRRRDQPLRFWIVAACLLAITMLGLLGTVGQIFRPHGL